MVTVTRDSEKGFQVRITSITFSVILTLLGALGGFVVHDALQQHEIAELQSQLSTLETAQKSYRPASELVTQDQYRSDFAYVREALGEIKGNISAINNTLMSRSNNGVTIHASKKEQ